MNPTNFLHIKPEGRYYSKSAPEIVADVKHDRVSSGYVVTTEHPPYGPTTLHWPAARFVDRWRLIEPAHRATTEHQTRPPRGTGYVEVVPTLPDDFLADLHGPVRDNVMRVSDLVQTLVQPQATPLAPEESSANAQEPKAPVKDITTSAIEAAERRATRFAQRGDYLFAALKEANKERNEAIDARDVAFRKVEHAQASQGGMQRKYDELYKTHQDVLTEIQSLTREIIVLKRTLVERDKDSTRARNGEIVANTQNAQLRAKLTTINLNTRGY